MKVFGFAVTGVIFQLGNLSKTHSASAFGLANFS